MARDDLSHRSRPPSVIPLSSSLSRIRSRLRAFSSLENHPADLEEDAHGAYGLNLLCEPSETHVDFIFVHGLGGGSRKTWCHSSGPETFWPKEWLPSEPCFKHARIHSYGYNSNWTKTQQSHLGIQDFAQALLADMHNSPDLRKNGDTPIVLVAHSMGGLVAKKAYLLARRDPVYQEFAKRICSMYFLATPHRGADSAQTLSRLLSASFAYRSKAFLDELIPGSAMLQAINDDFRHVCGDLQLWSFFEGVPTTLGPGSFVVVEKASAVMDLPGEHIQYLEADHRLMCKFESPAHPNYQILQRCLLRAVEDIERDRLLRQQSNLSSEMKTVSTFLEIDGRPEAELLDILEKQQPGTCTWLTEHPTFSTWLSNHSSVEVGTPASPLKEHAPRFLWLHGAPGSGKSTVCGHVIRFLEERNFECSYHFLKHGNTEASTLSATLRSLAFQMALSNSDIRKAILTMASNNERFNPNDHNMIWNGVFMGQIFKTAFPSPHLWVIDALDECANKSWSTLLHLLSKIPRAVPLQVFITSRPSVQVQRALTVEPNAVLELETGGESSKLDIAKFLRSRWPHGSGSDFGERLISKILAKSNGIFLWVSLVINRLEETYAEEDMVAVLHDVPTEMNEFYNRIALAVADTPNLELAKCVLKWTVCTARALSVDELREAVRLDINRTLTATNDRLAHLCGNLITVDRQSNIHVIHDTVIAFLLQCNSDLRIDLEAAHARLAEVCLGYLTGKDFMPAPQGRSRPFFTSKTQPDPILADYACAHFSFHLTLSSDDTDAPFLLLGTFFGSNVLRWIDHVARRRSLRTLVRAAQDLRAFLSRRAQDHPLLDKPSRLASSWVTDLTRILAAFGSNLIDSPSCIYVMIPAISPPQSMIHQHFAKGSPRQRLLGVSSERNWDDRISSFIWEHKATALAASEQYLAVGVSNKGVIMLYDSATLQLVGNLDHGEKIRNLVFGAVTGSLVAYGSKKISFWNSRRECLWAKNLGYARTPMAISFSVEEDQLLVCERHGQIRYLCAEDGSDRDKLPMFHSNDPEPDEADRAHWIWPGTQPKHVCMSPVHGLAAMTYRGAPVTIWDIERRQKVGNFYTPGQQGIYQQVEVHDMVFNPIPELNLLAIAYDGVGIVTCDPWTRKQHGHQGIDTQILVSSPDGRTLVAGALHGGTIHILAFETSLKVLHRISAFRVTVRCIAFSPDNLRIYEVRDNFCNAWEPQALVRRPDNLADNPNESLNTQVSAPRPGMRAKPVTHDDHITCVAYPEDSNHIFCGRKDGGISIYDAATGTRLYDFRLYPIDPFGWFKGIDHLEWHAKKSVLVAVSHLNHCIAVRVAMTPGAEGELVLSPIFDRYTKHLIRRVLINYSADLFHITTTEGDEVWDSTGGPVGSYNDSTTLGEPEHLNKQWIQHPTDPACLLMLRRTMIHVFCWDTLKPLTPAAGLRLSIPSAACSAGIEPPLAEWTSLLPTEWTSHKDCQLIVRARKADKDHSGTCFEVLDVSNLVNGHNTPADLSANCHPKDFLSQIRVVIGMHKSLLYFVDVKGWVSSVALKGLQSAVEYTRHFFIPRSWMVSEKWRGLLRLMPRTSSVAVAHQDDLLIFHGFLELEEKVIFMTDKTLVKENPKPEG